MQSASLVALVVVTSAKSFCETLGNVSESCDCVDEDTSGVLRCHAEVFDWDSLNATLAFKPCALPATYDLEIFEARAGIHKHVVGESFYDDDLAVSAVRLPTIGNVTLKAHLKTEASGKRVSATLTVDACKTKTVLGKEVELCGGEIPGSPFPFHIFSFDRELERFCINPTHYGTPPWCVEDEFAVEINGNSVCASSCTSSEDCPVDVPHGTEASSQCSPTGLANYCGLKCGKDTGCPDGAKCVRRSWRDLTGVCAFRTNMALV